MYKLRRSRFVKFIAGILIVTLCAAIVANLVGTYLIMEENLYYASKQQLQQKVYSYIYEYTANDLMRYLNIAEDFYSNDKSYQNYNQSELDLFRSKYSPENTNIYFEITDDYGNIILNNETDIRTDAFSFSSTYVSSSSFYHDTYYYKQGGSDKSDYFTEVGTTSKYPDSQHRNEYESENEPATAIAENDSLNEPTTLNDTPSEQEKPVPVTDDTEYTVETYEIINEFSGNITKLSYRYNGTIETRILSYIKDELKHLTYDITEFTATQSDFYIHYFDEDLDTYDIAPVYGAMDNSVPTKSFSTVFLTDGKEINLEYSYNGSFSISEFKSRLQYLSLIVRNIDDDNLNFSYKQKEGIQLKVQVFVPHYSAYVRDIYFYAEEFVDIAILYKDNIIPITVIDFIGLIASLVFIFWSAGFIPKRNEPIARGLHAIPFDLYLFLSVLAAIGCFAMVDTSDELFTVLGFLGWAFIGISIIYTIPVRVRTKTLHTNTVICKTYKAIKKAAEITDEATGSKLSIIVTVFAFIFISLCEILLFVAWDNEDAAVFIIFARLLELPFVILTLIVLTALHNGARAISKGDISYRISYSLLMGPFKKHAKYLNNINDAVNNAVDERMRSESLKTELITNVSHDLKTPLTSIVNYVDLLKKTDIKDEKALGYIEVIDRQSQRLKKLTTDIVEASKAATGNIEVNYEDTVLNVILLQTNGEYIERLEEKALTLVQDIPDKEITVSTDGRLLWRVIDNLMNNICKYSMPGTRVYMSLWEHNGRAFISFRNISKTKLNISPDALTERFVRGDTSRNTEGSGLGLSIANSLTEIMGGKLSIIIDGDLFKVTISFPTVLTEEAE